MKNYNNKEDYKNNTTGLWLNHDKTMARIRLVYDKTIHITIDIQNRTYNYRIEYELEYARDY